MEWIKILTLLILLLACMHRMVASACCFPPSQRATPGKFFSDQCGWSAGPDTTASSDDCGCRGALYLEFWSASLSGISYSGKPCKTEFYFLVSTMNHQSFALITCSCCHNYDTEYLFMKCLQDCAKTIKFQEVIAIATFSNFIFH